MHSRVNRSTQIKAGIFRRHDTPSGDKDWERASELASLPSFSSLTSKSGAERKAEERRAHWASWVPDCLSRSSKSSSAMAPSSSGGESGTTCSMTDSYQVKKVGCIREPGGQAEAMAQGEAGIGSKISLELPVPDRISSGL